MMREANVCGSVKYVLVALSTINEKHHILLAGGAARWLRNTKQTPKIEMLPLLQKTFDSGDSCISFTLALAESAAVERDWLVNVLHLDI